MTPEPGQVAERLAKLERLMYGDNGQTTGLKDKINQMDATLTDVKKLAEEAREAREDREKAEAVERLARDALAYTRLATCS